MAETEKRLFVGIKISTSLQNELNSPAPELSVTSKVTMGSFSRLSVLGDGRLIGRYVKDGFPVADIADVSRNVRSIVNPITRGHAIGEDSVHIYAILSVLFAELQITRFEKKGSFSKSPEMTRRQDATIWRHGCPCTAVRVFANHQGRQFGRVP